VLVMNSNQARKLSLLNTSGTNPIVQQAYDDRSVGRYVTKVIGDLPGSIQNIVVEPMMPKDCIFLLNTDMIKVCYMQPMTLTDAKTSDAEDYEMKRLLTEFTFEIHNGTKAHGLISGLNV